MHAKPLRRLSVSLGLLLSAASPGVLARTPQKTDAGQKEQRVGRTGGPQAPTGQPVKAPKDALLGAVDEITRQVSALRALPLSTPFKRGILTRGEIGEKLRERISKEYTPAEVRTESGVLQRLGLLPVGVDYEKMLFDLLTEQVAGFYDPYSRTLYVADWLPLEMQRPAMAHEIQHALQDQHFDLRRFSQPLKEDGDRQLARAALVEGDGTAVMLEFVAQSMGLDLSKMPDMVSRLGKQMMQMSRGATPAFRDAPAVLRETLLFPYAAGLDFVESMRATQPWSRIDEVFQKPPDSTEQVMHPEKYQAHELPVPVTPAPLTTLGPPGTLAEVRRDVLGEMVFKIWFESKMPAAQAERAAAGWGGDRMVAYAAPEKPTASGKDVGKESGKDAGVAQMPTVVILSAWDTEGDARETEKAGQKLQGALSEERDVGKESSYSVERRGRLVLFLCGVPKTQQPKVAEEVFRTWKVEFPAPPAAVSKKGVKP